MSVLSPTSGAYLWDGSAFEKWHSDTNNAGLVVLQDGSGNNNASATPLWTVPGTKKVDITGANAQIRSTAFHNYTLSTGDQGTYRRAVIEVECTTAYDVNLLALMYRGTAVEAGRIILNKNDALTTSLGSTMLFGALGSSSSAPTGSAIDTLEDAPSMYCLEPSTGLLLRLRNTSTAPTVGTLQVSVYLF